MISLLESLISALAFLKQLAPSPDRDSSVSAQGVRLNSKASVVLLLVCLSFASHEANGQEERYWGTIVRHPPANYVLRMDDGKLLNAEWESGYHRWSIGQRIILTTENGSGFMFFNNKQTQVAVFAYNPAQIGR